MHRMQPRPSRWACDPYEVALGERIAAGLGVSSAIGTVLARRGFRDVDEARAFLAAGERHDPLTLPGVAEARELIGEHVRRGSRIAVFGDYDVDGVCSTAMMVRTLRALSADPVWELPSRFDEGYGLSTAAVERLAARGVALLVTVDCGITAVEQVAAARAAGLDVVVSDHHRPGAELPDCPVVHPSPGEAAAYPADLCAAGVVLKLSEALRGEAGEEDLELAALATVCDLVPLRGENRRIVREGLRALSRSRRPGLRALMDVAAVAPAEVSEHSCGFRLGPRINAAGRMGRADAALELLLTEDGARAKEVARELDLLNRDRREAETRILFEADAACSGQAAQAAVVVAGEGWHPGVVGIVASRLVERWRRPAVVIALDGEEGRGSGRSISAYDLHAGLAACETHLLRFGGHRMAAGVELQADALDGFRAALAAHAGALLAPGDLIPVERVDAVVPGGALGLELAEELEQLRPFGMGNPQPTLLVPAARVQNVTGMGEERQHARFTLVTGATRARGVAFGATQRSLAPALNEPHDVALRLEANRWNDAVEPRVLLRALCVPRRGELRVLGEDVPFWERVRREFAADPAGPGTVAVPGGAVRAAAVDRRGEGFAGVAVDLLTSGESVVAAVADVPRRRESLERLVAGAAPSGLTLVSTAALARDPALVAGFAHLVVVDPPLAGEWDAFAGLGPRVHLAWGPGEIDFALQVWRAELDLRPALTDAFRALRALAPDASASALEEALCGAAAYPRSPECCGRLLRILDELGLVELALEAPRCRALDGVRTELELSAAYHGYRGRLAAAERALGLAAPAPGVEAPLRQAS
jgi:single-stranded-DNA-specific exonuclease